MSSNDKRTVANYYYKDPSWREKHLRYIGEKVTCAQCGGKVRRDGISTHMKTRKCQKANAQKDIDLMAALQEVKSLLSNLAQKA